MTPSCPYCLHDHAKPVRFTPWGGVLGPRLLSLVKCGGCGKDFNGKSGRRIERAVKIYTWVTLGMIAMIVALTIYSFVGPRDGSNKSSPSQRVAPQAVG